MSAIEFNPRHLLRILVLNGDLPVFPGWGAVEFLHLTRLARLVTRLGLVSLVQTQEQKDKKRVLSEAGLALYLWQNPQLALPPTSSPLDPPKSGVGKRLAKQIHHLLRAGFVRPRDTAIQDLQFNSLAGPVLKALSDEWWQALIVVQSQCAHWLDYLPRFPVSVLVLHDVRALVYERRARSAARPGERLASWFEALRYRRFEKEYCRKYDLVVTVSAVDEAWVRQHYRPSRVVTIPIPLDAEYFGPRPEVLEAPARIVFTGMMNHPPNVDAACFFARQVLPRVQAEVPEAEFWIVGRDPALEVAALAKLPGVVVTGFVPDIRPYMAEATVLVAPLRYGSGMRQKILEAWAMQKCVVATHIGAEGLDYVDGVNILIADEARTLAEKVLRAMRESHLRDQIRVAGRQVVLTQHQPARLAEKYNRAIAEAYRQKTARCGPLRAVIDMRWMRPGVAGGIENLARSFVSHLLRLDAFNQYTMLVPAEVRYDFDLRGNPNFRLVVTSGAGPDLQRAIRVGERFLRRQLKAPSWRSPAVGILARARALEAEVALSIPGYIHPDLYPLANVLVVPDIQHEYCPEFFSPAELRIRRQTYRDAIHRAVHICAISEFTRQSLIERLAIRPERITTTHLAADPMFHPDSEHRGRSTYVLQKYGLQAGEYLLFPANFWPHKNHRTAFRALNILREAYGLRPRLVCTGAYHRAHADLLTVLADLKLQGQVDFLGYCPASDMPALYEGAAALIFPSLFEGFGLPLLEAMWCDCPIVASHTTSVPEIAGDAALLVDPRSPDALADATYRVLTDTALRQALVRRGSERVKEFSWRRFTTEVVRILYQVHGMRLGV